MAGLAEVAANREMCFLNSPRSLRGLAGTLHVVLTPGHRPAAAATWGVVRVLAEGKGEGGKPGAGAPPVYC